MRQETITHNIYKFEELSEKAKEKARNWFRQGNLDYEWWNFTYEDFINTMKEKNIIVKNIQFSGFWSQGDGASFETDWIEIKNAQGEEIGRYKIIRLPSHYSHECTMIDTWELFIDDEKKETELEIIAKNFKEEMRQYAKELYSNLEKEYEFLNSDECLDETIIANEYEFLENGENYI